MDVQRLMRQDESDFSEVMRSSAGIRFIAYLVDISGANSQSYQGDINASLFAEGRRSIGLMLLSRIHSKGTDEAEYLRAVMERNELRRKDAKDAMELEKGADSDGFSGSWSPRTGRE